MPPLSSLVVQRQIASMREVEEAISRQVLHGGDLLTNLLDMAPDREALLAGVLAESLGMPAAPSGRLPPPEHDALAAVGQELALRHAIFPLALEGQSLLCATSEPLSHEAIAELGAAIGRPLRFVASPFLRVREGIAAHYGVPLERRLVKLVAKLDGLRAPPGRSTRPPPVRRRPDPVIRAVEEPTAPAEIRPVPPLASRLEHIQDEPAERPSAPPTTAGQLGRWVRLVADAERRARARPARRKGPLAAGEAERLIDAAPGVDAVLDVFFAFASQFFEYSALFAVRGELAEGHDAWGPGTDRDAIVAIGVPLDLPSCLSRARARRAPLLERIPDEGLDREILGDLQRLRGGTARGLALVLPVVVRGRTIALLVGEDGAADVDLGSLGPVLAVAHLATAAIERLALARKRGGASGAIPLRSLPVRVATLPPGDHPLATREGRARATEALVQALDGTPSTSTLPASALRAASARPSGPATDPYVGPPLDDPFDLPGTAPAGLPLWGGSPPPVEDEEREVEPRTPHRSSPRPPPPSGPPSGLPSPAPTSLPSYGARRSPPRPEHASLLARAARGGPEGADAREILLGEARQSLPALMAHFPGPLSVDRLRARQELAAASGCGVLLSIIAEIGRPALPFVTTRVSSADVDQRFWATHLLAELPFGGAATAVVPRLFDEDLSVRRIARRSAAALLALGMADDPIGHALEDIARATDEPGARRALAIETLGELRLPRLVPPLLRVLEDPSGAVQQIARRALLVLTRQDFGLEVAAWAAWWAAHGQQHRVEWLIDALTHAQPSLRRAAADELKQVTQEYFGYYDDLPPRERERAQARYREWWRREGQLRFY